MVAGSATGDHPAADATPPVTGGQTWAVPRVVKFILLPGLLVVIVVAIVAAIRISADRPETEIPGVVSLVPGPGEQVLLQSPIGVVLAPAYDATLSVNGVAIPEGQINAPLNPGEVIFQPGQGKVITELLPNVNCMQAQVWRRELGPQTATTREWCFRAN